MVKLTKIYTRGGDAGETSLGNGQRTPKQSVRVAAYGAVDEANAALGLARLHCQGETADMVSRIQNDLFDLGADLCQPLADDEGAVLRIIDQQVDRLETEIDAMNEQLAPLTSFILPGGTEASAYLHLGRTITRRAERLMCELMASEEINPASLRYINRLSDHLFQLARMANDEGRNDVLWQPGANR